MTLLITRRSPGVVRVDELGAPAHLDAYPLVGEIRPLQRAWPMWNRWSRPVSRECWKVLLCGQLLCEIYLDLLADDSWFIERVYD